MAATSSPFGLIAVQKADMGYNSNGTSRYFMPTNSSAGIFPNDIVVLNSGSVARGAATPTTTLSANSPLGIFAGAKFVDASGYLQYAPYIPANAVTNGYTGIQVYVNVAMGNDLYKIQADGPVALSNIGLNAQLGGFTAPTVTAGANPVSGVLLLSASLATTTTFAVRVVDVLTPTDAYSEVIVRWNFGVPLSQLSLAE